MFHPYPPPPHLKEQIVLQAGEELRHLSTLGVEEAQQGGHLQGEGQKEEQEGNEAAGVHMRGLAPLLGSLFE